MFENLSPYLFYKLFLFIPLILVINWSVRKSAEKDKISRSVFYFIGVLFVFGLFYIVFKYS